MDGSMGKIDHEHEGLFSPIYAFTHSPNVSQTPEDLTRVLLSSVRHTPDGV